MRAFAIILLVSASFLLVSQNAEPPAWRIIGPGGGGAQFRPTVSPHDPNTALIACDMTGAYITHDGGRRWREFNLRTRVDAFAFDPINPKVIYAGSSGLFRSEDGGGKWALIFPNPKSGIRERMAGDHADQSFLSGDNWPGGRIQAIRVDPEDTGRIFIGIQSRGLHLFYSTDAGKSWKPGGQVPGQAFRKLYIDPTSPRGNRRLLVFGSDKLSLWVYVSANIPKQTYLFDQTFQKHDVQIDLNRQQQRVTININEHSIQLPGIDTRKCSRAFLAAWADGRDFQVVFEDITAT